MSLENLEKYREDRKIFIERLKKSLDRHIAKKDMDAWFFNDWSEDNICRCNGKINKYINARIPGKWKITGLYGNGTNVGQGAFWNDEYCLELLLSCYNEEYEEYIDNYCIEGE